MIRRQLKASVLPMAILLAATAGSGNADAADKKGNFALHGAGALSCEQLTSGLLGGHAAVREALGSWILGYLSALNRERTDTYDITPIQDPNALVNMVVSVCDKDRNARVETVVFTIGRLLERAKVAEESPEQTVNVLGRTATLRKDTLIALERVLVADKLLTGKADGEFDGNTEAALKKYQEAQKLPVTGLPDAATIARALIETQAQKGSEPPAAQQGSPTGTAPLPAQHKDTKKERR